MTRKPTRREVERWIEQRDDDDGGDDYEATITETTVETGWEPPAGESKPEPGTETTRVFRDANGELVAEPFDGEGGGPR